MSADRHIAPMLHDDVPTLFEAPHSQDTSADVVLLGVPYEGMLVGDRHTLYPPGSRPPETFYARFGADEAPDAIRKASVIYSLLHEGGVAAEVDFTPITDHLSVIDAGNHTLESAEALVETVAASGGVTVALGGDHLVPLPLFRGKQKGKRDRTAADSVYISLDIDVVDPAFVPAQKYPDAAGLAPREILTMMRRATASKPLAGFDLCCFSPRYDVGGYGALTAARFALEAVYCVLRAAVRAP